MPFKQVLVSISLLLSEISRATIVQQPLHVSDFGSPLGSSAALAESKASVCDGIFRAKPVAWPCYHLEEQNNGRDCSVVEQSKTDGYWLSNQPGGYYYGNWASCQALGQTCAIPVNDNWSNAADHKYCYQGSVPDMMYNVSSIEDIQKGLGCAHNMNRTLVIKNTGHDWKGRGGAPHSLALWTHNLQSSSTPSVPIVLSPKFKPFNCDNHPEETVFHFAAGEQWGGAYEFAEENNLAVVGGTCPTVGIAGWIHGGGHSPLSPIYGLGVDNVRQIEIVTPQGELLIANECTEQDLFFAVKGGGGGTWGVVTNITYKAVPKFEVQAFTANLTTLDSEAIVEFIAILTSNAIRWATKGWGGYIKTGSSLEIVNPAESFGDAWDDMLPLLFFFHVHGTNYTFKTHASWYEYYSEHLKPPEAHIGQYAGAVASRLLPPSVFDNDTRGKLTSVLSTLHKSSLNLWLMLVTPTAFPHTNTSALHPSWRDAIWSVRINSKWDQYYQHTSDDFWQHFNKAHQAMEPLRKLAPDMGVSINEADIWEEDHEHAFWGDANYQRLAGIKRKVDPDNVLSTYMAVGWDKSADRYKCYPKQDLSQ